MCLGPSTASHHLIALPLLFPSKIGLLNTSRFLSTEAVVIDGILEVGIFRLFRVLLVVDYVETEHLVVLCNDSKILPVVQYITSTRSLIHTKLLGVRILLVEKTLQGRIKPLQPLLILLFLQPHPILTVHHLTHILYIDHIRQPPAAAPLVDLLLLKPHVQHVREVFLND